MVVYMYKRGLMKQLVKTTDEYANDLSKIAPSDEVQKYLDFINNGNKVQAIRILKKFKLVE